MKIAQIEQMNTILLLKWWWKIMVSPDREVCKRLKEKYSDKYEIWRDDPEKTKNIS